MVYKLQEYAGQPRRKRSEGKATWPGHKQVYRRMAAGGAFISDCIGLENAPPSGEPLLQPVMRNGQRLAPPESLSAIRRRVQRQTGGVAAAIDANQSNPPYLIEISNELIKMAAQLDKR